MNFWIAVAVAENVGVVETAAEFFKKRAGKATGEGLMKFLRYIKALLARASLKVYASKSFPF